jgi:phage tail-like protein
MTGGGADDAVTPPGTEAVTVAFPVDGGNGEGPPNGSGGSGGRGGPGSGGSGSGGSGSGGAGAGGDGRTGGVSSGAGDRRTGGRAGLPGLTSRYPLGLQLPGVYAEDDFIQRFTAGLDDVLAPILCTLDNLPAYLAPHLAPADFVDLLAAWLGADRGGARPGGTPRAAVADAVRVHAVRGTRAGLASAIRLAFGVEPEITETGGAVGSVTPGSPLPGSAQPAVTVRLRVPDPTAFDTRALTALVARNRPAHVPFTVEVVAEGT